MVSADLSAAKHFRHDLPKEEFANMSEHVQCVQNMFPMFLSLDKRRF